MSKPTIIKLDEPIKRGEKKHSSIELRKPTAGELRGTKLSDVLTMDVATMNKVLPRISEPVLTEEELNAMNLADFTELALGFVGFLEPKKTSL
ncbi:MAG: phage tail assembly protein [Candidatus Pacearchaeota archaeon]|nr:phage tail assembly protein [Candidatus Pacearchaeota archaeon]